MMHTYVKHGSVLKCSKCNRTFTHVDGSECSVSEDNPGLGDRVELLLSSLGVTEESYAAAKAKFGLPPNCGCAARKRWLNKVSEWWRGQS